MGVVELLMVENSWWMLAVEEVKGTIGEQDDIAQAASYSGSARLDSGRDSSP
jgi:hypothetical protein